MDKYYLAALSSVFTYLPAANLWELISRFGSAQKAYEADLSPLRFSGLIPPNLVPRYKERYRASLPDNLANYCDRKKIHLLDFREPEYPEALRHIYNPPPVLYVQGQWPQGKGFLGMVGSRKATSYGVSTAKKLSGACAAQGIVIVSGGAYGIDTASHKGALEAKGATLAVLGSGLDHWYPSSNYRLFMEILERGALVTEFAPDIPPFSTHFPLRNRIIVGLCKSILVVEAALKSGAIITARIASEEGRDVYAVPGDITAENSKGTNSLIQDGAKLITGPEDVLAEFNLLPVNKKQKVQNISLFQELPEKDVKEAELILQIIKADRAVTIDEIVMASGLKVQRISYLLLNMEMSGMVTKDVGARYRCC